MSGETNSAGRFGRYGGQYVPETLMTALTELAAAFERTRGDAGFEAERGELLARYAGRPTPLYRAERLERALPGSMQVWLKREDLLHTGAHKLNNAVGQVLLARRLGKRRIVAETGAGQHGVAVAAVCARFGMECTVYMGRTDLRRQQPNLRRMELFGADVRAVDSGRGTLQDATSEAIRDWVATVRTTHYVIGSVVGPHPFPTMVAEFQSVIGREAREQILAAAGRLPTHVVACVGGGSNAMGIFRGFIDDAGVRLVAVEGHGGRAGHAASLGRGEPGVLHGSMSLLLQDEHGQVLPAHSVSAGLDYPGVGPELSFLKDCGRLDVAGARDAEALDALRGLCRLEGILPALESAHALAHLERLAREATASLVVVNLSGRGDKDLGQVAEAGRAS